MPFRTTLEKFLRKIGVIEPLYPEALVAYYHRLPNTITVNWFRDGQYIIGRINAEGYEFATQALSPEEFVEMVNDAVFAVYEIPGAYFEFLKEKQFKPSTEALANLQNTSIPSSSMSFQKVPQLA